jgi:hypothetical protein
MTPDEVLARLDGTLSLRRRIGYVTLALAGLTGSGLIGLLWLTEPALPARTRAAFALLMVIGLAWTFFGGWALTRRTPLYARDRVVAAWIGLGAWLVFAAGALAISTAPALLALVATLGVVAAGNLRAARSARRRLIRNREALAGQP